jgi:hypothetical protein
MLCLNRFSPFGGDGRRPEGAEELNECNPDRVRAFFPAFFVSAYFIFVLKLAAQVFLLLFA